MYTCFERYSCEYIVEETKCQNNESVEILKLANYIVTLGFK